MSRPKQNPNISRAPFVAVSGRPPAQWPWFLGLVALVLLVYLPALNAGFIWNDPDYVTRPDLRPLAGLWRIWFEVGATEQYYPLLHTAFWIQHRIWGDSSTAYHVFNALLHGINACLLVGAVSAVLRIADCGVRTGETLGAEQGAGGRGQGALKGREQGAGSRGQGALLPWLCGLLFAVHPVYVESVAWISEQKNTLSLTFYLLAGMVYLRSREQGAGSREQGAGGREQGRRSREQGIGGVPDQESGSQSAFRNLKSAMASYWLATALFVCAILSKSLTASLPAAILVVLWWRRGKLDWRQDWVPLLPWFALGACIGAFTGWVEHAYIGAQGEDFALNFIERGVLAGRVILFYMGKYLFPLELIFIYPRWEIDATSPVQWIFPAIAVGLLPVLWLLRRRARGPLAAYLFYTGSLFPTMGFFNVYAFQFSYVADHWNYLPSIGILVAVVQGWVWLGSRMRLPGGRGLGLGLVSVLALLLSVKSHSLTHEYRDSETLFTRTLEKNPDAWMAQQNLGVFLMARGDVAGALEKFERTVALQPSNEQGWNNLGAVYLRLGRDAEAQAYFQKSVDLKPRYAEGRYNLALSLLAGGRTSEAAAQLEEVVRIQPMAAEAHRALGRIEEEAGRHREAIQRFNRAIEARPDYPEALADLGRMHLVLGEHSEAVQFLERASNLAPSPGVLESLGLALASVGRAGEGARALQSSLQLEPDRPGTLFNLGLLLARSGRIGESVQYFQRAVALKPDYLEASQALAQALSETGRNAEAAAVRERAGQVPGKAGP